MEVFSLKCVKEIPTLFVGLHFYGEFVSWISILFVHNMRLYPKDFINIVRWINHSHSQGTQNDDVDVPDRGSSDL